MHDAAIQDHLRRLFARHEVELEPDEDWLVTDGDFPAIRANWQEGAAGAPGRLDVDVVLSEERRIEESFAGTGGGEAGCRDALDRFAQSDLHVLLAACWYVTDDRKLQVQAWEIGVRTWDVFIGLPMLRGADVAAPPELTTALRTAIWNEALSPELHWIRLFCQRADNGDVRVEALLDNESWPAGDRMLTALTWPAAAQAYSTHCLVVLDVRDY